MFDSMKISTSALTAYRTRLNTIARNIANMHTTRDAAGRASPYRRQEVVFAVGSPMTGGVQTGLPREAGVHVESIAEDSSPFRVINNPGHPDADENGNVFYPNVDMQHEMVDALLAQRAYEANIVAYEVSRNMMSYSLRLLG